MGEPRRAITEAVLTMRSHDTSAPKTSHRHNPRISAGFNDDFKTSQGNGCDVSRSSAIVRVCAACDGVTVDKPKPGNDEFEERAAILEYDGGHRRLEAERLARAELDSRDD